jgi:hypothetical protein
VLVITGLAGLVAGQTSRPRARTGV